MIIVDIETEQEALDIAYEKAGEEETPWHVYSEIDFEGEVRYLTFSEYLPAYELMVKLTNAQHITTKY